MEDYLIDLIARLEDDSLRPGEVLPPNVKFSSKLTISHSAREEADQLKDPAYIPIFQKLLEKEKKTITKIHIIRYLTRLADKVKQKDIPDYVLTFVKQEKTRWVKETALRNLIDSKLEVVNEREFLFELAQNKDWSIRGEAVRLLSKLPEEYHRRVEDLCLQQIPQFKNKHHQLSTFSSALGRVGTDKSIPALKQIVQTSKKSLAVLSALGAISQISGKKEIQFYVDCFKAKRDSFVKKNLVKLICYSGSTAHAPLLIKRVKTLLAKKRKRNVIYTSGTEPEIVTIIKFLDHHATNDSTKLINWIKDKKWDNLDKTETDWLEKRMDN